MAEIFHVLELIAFLLSCAEGRMIPHQGSEHAQCEEAQQQLPGCIRPESAQISTGVEEAAHIK